MPAVSIAQQRLFGMVHAAQKGSLKDPPPRIARIAKTIKPEDAEDFARTKHDKLPEKQPEKQADKQGSKPGGEQNKKHQKVATLHLPPEGSRGVLSPSTLFANDGRKSEKRDLLARLIAPKQASQGPVQPKEDPPGSPKTASVLDEGPDLATILPDGPETGGMVREDPTQVLPPTQSLTAQQVAAHKFAAAVIDAAIDAAPVAGDWSIYSAGIAPEEGAAPTKQADWLWGDPSGSAAPRDIELDSLQHRLKQYGPAKPQTRPEQPLLGPHEQRISPWQYSRTPAAHRDPPTPEGVQWRSSQGTRTQQEVRTTPSQLPAGRPGVQLPPQSPGDTSAGGRNTPQSGSNLSQLGSNTPALDRQTAASPPVAASPSSWDTLPAAIQRRYNPAAGLSQAQAASSRACWAKAATGCSTRWARSASTWSRCATRGWSTTGST